jgi:Domain of unknown function (DUF6894)
MRYFFHVRRGSELLQDPEGQELEDLTAAHHEANEAARTVMAECLRSNRPLGLDRAIVIADENGAILSELSFEAALPTDDPSR